ncbi:hypothetical protein JVU11DRAFT_6290 [Chiua virens]|nr:hypothetical protein JVU11DRAFT_6290 [Chiua virens]
MTSAWYVSVTVLSFYKEELAGEMMNRVSMLAARTGTSKSDALKELVETTAKIFENALHILRESLSGMRDP